MIPFSLSFAVESVHGTFYGNSDLLTKQVQNVTIDSRKAGEGVLYVPVIGTVHDGHEFISSAFANGALCTLSDRKLDEDVPYILVKDTTDAFQELAAAYLEANRIPVVAITGSVGKTSTKEMLNAVLGQHFRTYHTPGNLNNQTGVPQAVFQIEKEHNLAILELGTNHPGEIRSLSKITKPDICVITNIGVAHIEFFHTREGIFQGKKEILEYAQPKALAIVNGDDDFLPSISGAILYGLNENCAFRATDIEDLGMKGIRFLTEIDGKTVPFSIPSPGVFNVYNALASIAAGYKLGMTVEELQKGVSSYQPTAGRMNVHTDGKYNILDDSYNANPASMNSAIGVLGKLPGRHVCILGDMLELGEESPRFHKEVGEYAASNGCDLLLSVGQFAEDMCLGFESAGTGVSHCYATREEMEQALPSLLKEGDSILVKASHGIHLEHTVDYLLTLSK